MPAGGFRDDNIYAAETPSDEATSPPSDNHKTKNGALMEKLRKKTLSVPPDDL